MRILFFLFFSYAALQAQVTLHPNFNGAYFQRTQLIGATLGTGVEIPLAERSALRVRAHYGYADGSRNFDRTTTSVNLEYDDYLPSLPGAHFSTRTISD